MTLTVTTSRASYPGTGTVGPFPFPFRVFAATDLLLTRRDAAGVETTLTNGTDYAVAGVGDATGSVTLTLALAVGETLAIRRAPPLTQTTSLQNQGAYFGKTHEDTFDRIEMQLLSLQDQIRRAPRFAESYDPDALALGILGSAGKVLGWSSATHLENLTLDASAIAVPAGGRTVATVSQYLANNATDFNPRDFGAVWDGVADDSVPIQAAINAASVTAGGRVRLPAGVAKFTVGLTIDAALDFGGVSASSGPSRGQIGPATTRLSYTGAGVAISMVGSGAEDRENLHLHDFSLDGTVAALGGILVGSTGLIVNSSIKNVQLTGFTKVGAYGMRLRRCLLTVFENILSRGNYDGFYVAAGDIVTTTRWINCYAYTNARNGFRSDGAFQSSTVFGLGCESNDAQGLYLADTTAYNDFFGYYSEDNCRTSGNAPVYISGAGVTKNTFFGGAIQDDGGFGTLGRYIDLDVCSKIIFYDIKLPGNVSPAIHVTASTMNCKYFTGDNDTTPAMIFGNGLGRMLVCGGSVPSRYQTSLTNNQDIAFPNFTAGVFIVTDVTNNYCAIFQLRGAANAVVLVSDPSAKFSITANTAGRINLYYNAGYRLQNLSGGTIGVLMAVLNAENV